MDVTSTAAFTDTFKGCGELREVRLYGLKANLSFSNSPHISKKSILCIINNASASSIIIINLHSTAYVRLADDTDILSALAEKEYITLVS